PFGIGSNVNMSFRKAHKYQDAIPWRRHQLTSGSALKTNDLLCLKINPNTSELLKIKKQIPAEFCLTTKVFRRLQWHEFAHANEVTEANVA
ncbi:hypothetical protein, partial [Leptospira wolffii]|uniref:hypothetical protein n=1 Tax=Leptospira wolffii TaxID=409998 RepID=UPI001AEF9B87